MYDLSFGMYFLYTLCTRKCCNRLVVLQSAEILGLIIRFAIHFLCVTTAYTKALETMGKMYDLSFGMYFFSRGVQDDDVVVLQSAEILWLIISFAIHFLRVTTV